MEVRTTPCGDCPFNRAMSHVEIAEASEGAPQEMLCHSSISLDGCEPDVLCRGFRNNVELSQQ